MSLRRSSRSRHLRLGGGSQPNRARELPSLTKPLRIHDEAETQIRAAILLNAFVGLTGAGGVVFGKQLLQETICFLKALLREDN